MSKDKQSYNPRIKVPLAIESEIEIPIAGVANVPLRSLFAALVACIPAGVVFFAPTIPFEIRVFITITILFAAVIISIPKSQGIWIGTLFAYRLFASLFPSVTQNGKSLRARNYWEDNNDLVSQNSRPTSNLPIPFLKKSFSLPHIEQVGAGFFQTDRGGYRGVLKIEGPITAIGGISYENWGRSVMAWIDSLECPVQFFSLVEHYDQAKAENAFDRRVKKGWDKMSSIMQSEKQLVSYLANKSFGLSSYIVIAPETAGENGMLYDANLTDMEKAYAVSEVLVQEKITTAFRTAAAFPGLGVRPATKDEIIKLMQHSPLGSSRTIATEKLVQITNPESSAYYIPLSVTKLARSLTPGDIVDTVMRAQCQATVSVWCTPVSARIARKKVERIRQTRSYAAAKKGNSNIADSMAIQETQQIEQALAEGITPFMMSINLSVFDDTVENVQAAAERIKAHLMAKTFSVVHATQPGLLPMLSCSLGGPPLHRSCIMTLSPVVERCLPMLGTPFNNLDGALMGVNNFTGSPSYIDIWKQGTNHNMLIVANAGSGKSVAAKTLLYRHAIAGTNCVIIDPDNEYRNLIYLLKGEYYELGKDSLNVMAVSQTYNPDQAAAAVAPILAVLAGESQFDNAGRPIRRLVIEDQYWLQQKLLEFFRRFDVRSREPILQDFVGYLEEAVIKSRNEQDEDRGRRIQERLAFYTQGKLAKFFNRQSTFQLGKRPVGIGFKALANEYSTDLTPAMAMVLTAVFAVMEKVNQRFLVVIDEAHHLTSDPDSGRVLDSIVRRGRKAAVGVWMATQKIDDFISTPLGRTLAASSSLKVIMGVQENMLDEVQEVFNLTDEEASALFPIHPGRAVILSDSGERGVVTFRPSITLMEQINTRPVVVANQDF